MAQSFLTATSETAEVEAVAACETGALRPVLDDWIFSRGRK
jgi:hypothetical protein